MALPGIPISEDECIGDSLATINNSFADLDARVDAAGSSVTVSDTPPSGASAGDLWFDSSSGVTSVYYDGTWVDVGGGDSGTSAGSVNGIVKSDGSGNFSAAVAGTDYLNNASSAAAKAWVVFDGFTGGVATIKNSYRISSVTRNSTGIYSINFTSGTFSNALYSYHGTCRDDGTRASWVHTSPGGVKTSSSCQVIVSYPLGAQTTIVQDSAEVCVVFFSN
jgi:hypothetical protein